MATGASTPGGQGSSHVPVRALVIVLAIQVALGIALVVWGTQGFPLPGHADDPDPTASAGSAASVTPPRPTAARFDGAWAWGLLREQVAKTDWDIDLALHEAAPETPPRMLQ